MNKIDQFFNNTDKISFIELKGGAYKALDQSLPYPIDTEDLIEGVKEEVFIEDISYEHIVDGMIQVLAIDPNFIHKDSYMASLDLILGDTGRFVQAKVLDFIREENPKLVYYLRFLYLNELGDSFNLYYYSRILYEIYEKDQVLDFRKEAIRILENLISMDEDFPLSYYELGLIHAKEESYNKAYLYFQKALERVDDDLVQEEIREKMRLIYPQVLLERGIDELNKGRLDQALDEFSEAKLLNDDATSNYYIGVVYEAQARLEDAISQYCLALEKGGEFRQVFQDLAIAYYKAGLVTEALASLNRGLKIHHEDSNLLYNRMVIYIALENFDKAKEDMETILQYGDVPDEILQNISIIKNNYGL